MSTTKKNNQHSEQNISSRIDEILSHLNVPEIEVDKNKIREPFLKMWEMEEGDKLSPENQFLTLVGLFIYYAHNALDDHGLKVAPARPHIVSALREWLAPELNKMIADEKTSGNPFKTFVETNVPKIDDVYTWENFLLTHQRSDEKEWTYRMKQCWFSTFFIRYGRADYIETACQFDSIPANARKDYVTLKLQNLFSKMGSSCQFTYTPVKRDS